jgi:SAM-dependent methyltransferase
MSGPNAGSSHAKEREERQGRARRDKEEEEDTLSSLTGIRCAPAERNRGPIAAVLVPLLAGKLPSSTSVSSSSFVSPPVSPAGVLEVACGTGQHAAFFAPRVAAALAGSSFWWQPTDLVSPEIPSGAAGDAQKEREPQGEAQGNECAAEEMAESAPPLGEAVKRWRKFADVDDAHVDPSLSAAAVRELRAACIREFAPLDVGAANWEATLPRELFAAPSSEQPGSQAPDPLRGNFDVYTANSLHIMPWEAVLAFCAGLGRILLPGRRFVCYGPFRRDGQFSGPGDAKFDVWLKENYPKGGGLRDLEAVSRALAQAGFEQEGVHAMPANNLLVSWIKLATGDVS